MFKPTSKPTYEELEARVQELEKSLLQFKVMETALRTTRTLISIMDLDSGIRFVNSSHEAVLGYTPDELRGRMGFDLIHPEDLERLKGLLARYLPKFALMAVKGLLCGQTVPITEPVEYRVQHKDGSWRWLESLGTIMDRRIYCFSCEISRRKEAEQERERMQQRLVNAAKLVSIGTLCAGLAHELNSPLTAVIGNAEMIEGAPNDAETVAVRARRIQTAAQRVMSLIDHIRRFSHPSRLDKREYLDINETIRSSLLLLDSLLEERRIDLSLELTEDLPMVAGEPSQLTSVFQNLILNAMDALDEVPDGKDRRIHLSSRVDGPGGVRIVVEDNAEGIPDEIARQVFDPFFTTKPIGKGTGLGLFVAQGIIKDHDGTISLSTSPGRGTRFEIFLPSAR